MCPRRKPTRVAIRFTEAGERVRVAKRSGSIIPAPDEVKQRRTPRLPTAGPKDTAPLVAAAASYTPPAELAPFLSASSDLYRIRRGKERVPPELRLPLRAKTRSRLRRKWEAAASRRRVAAAAHAAEAAMAAALEASAAAPDAARQRQQQHNPQELK